MSIVTTQQLQTLKSLIGSRIDFGIAPLLQISDSVTYPCSECYGRKYGHFFESPLLNLRVTSNSPKPKKTWLTFSPGADEPLQDGKDWAPLAVTESNEPALPRNMKRITPSVWDTELQVDGFSRVSAWTGFGEISRIELFSFAPYAAVVFSHVDGAEWSLYAEYDFAFWFNFDQDLAGLIRINGENSYTINAT